MPDRISREVVIDAPPYVGWAIVTEPRHVARWFSDEADENSQGWIHELHELRDYAARLGSSPYRS